MTLLHRTDHIKTSERNFAGYDADCPTLRHAFQHFYLKVLLV